MSVFKVEQAVDSLGFDLMASIQVDSIHWHGATTSWSRNGNKIMVGKPGKWTVGETDSLTFFYQGNPDVGSGFGYFNYDNHQTGPIVYTLSEPYGAAYWWPCKQTLSDKLDSMDIYMSIPPSMKAGCNGVLISNDSLNDTTRVMHWKHRYPIAAYLVSFAVSNYSAFTEYVHFYNRPDTLPVVNYVFPEALTDAKAAMPGLLRVLRLYDSLVGQYPFALEKYGHSQFTWGGGMEHQTMSSVVGFSFDLLAHELAHQWFGDKVTCGSWSDLWLNEGFATYMNALCYRYLKTDGEWLDHMRDVRGGATSQDDGSVFATDTVTINVLFSGNLRYNKAAFVLHMLREKVGDVAFFGALKKYLSTSGNGYNFARTTDLKSVMENESGKNLDTFFLRWFWGQGYPMLKINWQQLGTSVMVDIKQQPTHPSVPFFEIPVPILFHSKTRDTVITFYPTKLEQTFSIRIPFSIDTAEFDPRVVVLARASLGGVNLDKTKTGKFQLAPNPATDKMDIITFSNIVTSYQVFDITGRKVLESAKDFKHPFGDNITLNLANFSSGTYFIKIHTSNSLTSIKFIKQ